MRWIDIRPVEHLVSGAITRPSISSHPTGLSGSIKNEVTLVF